MYDGAIEGHALTNVQENGISFYHSLLHVYCIFKTSVFYLPTVVFIAKKEWFVPWKHMHVHE